MADPQFIDLAYTKAEQKEEAKEYNMAGPGGGEAPKYPWGLCIRLEKRELDKLGVKTLPNIDDEFHLAVIAKVTQVSQQSGVDQDDTQNVALQITMVQILDYESAQQEAQEAKKYGPETAAREGSEQKSIMAKYRS